MEDRIAQAAEFFETYADQMSGHAAELVCAEDADSALTRLRHLQQTLAWMQKEMQVLEEDLLESYGVLPLGQ